MVFVRESTTDNKQEQPFVCPIDKSDVKCTHKQKKNLESLFQKHASVFTKDEMTLDIQRQSNTRSQPYIKCQSHSLTRESHQTSFKRQRITYESFRIMVSFKKVTVLVLPLLCELEKRMVPWGYALITDVSMPRQSEISSDYQESKSPSMSSVMQNCPQQWI